MNKKGGIFSLILNSGMLIGGFVLLYYWHISPDLSQTCTVSTWEQINPLILLLSGTFLVLFGLFGLYNIFRTGRKTTA
jgi:hypothetical protein